VKFHVNVYAEVVIKDNDNIITFTSPIIYNLKKGYVECNCLDKVELSGCFLWYIGT